MANRIEFVPDQEEMMRLAFRSMSTGLWTALPGIIDSVDLDANTVSVQPAIKAGIRLSDGTLEYVSLPLCVDVPIMFSCGGGFVLTHPIAADDECLLVFSSRCIDAWWQSGGVQKPMDVRFHNLSDGFAFVGPRSTPNKISSISSSSAQLRTLDGTCYVEVTDSTVNVVAPTTVTIQAGTSMTLVAPDGITANTPTFSVVGVFEAQNSYSGAAADVACTINGDIQTTGEVTAQYGSGGIELSTHVHSGVETGSGETGAPV